MVGREAPFRPFSGREASISLNFSNWHSFFKFFLIPFLEKSPRVTSVIFPGASPTPHSFGPISEVSAAFLRSLVSLYL
jgi:hypothetical protein